MANEVTFAALSDAMAAEAISSLWLSLFQSPEAIPAHPAIFYGGQANGGASTTVTVPHYGFGGYDLMSATAEGTAASNVALTTGKSEVAVARYAIQREIGDLARMTDVNGVLNFQFIAADSYNNYVRTLVDLVANVADGFTATQTASSVMTLDDFLAAKSTLASANAQGPYLALLHPKQWGELELELATTAGGSLGFDQATPALIASMGPGYVGRLAGVDVFTSTSVPSSGGDRKGAMMAPGAIVWADGAPLVEDPANQVVYGERVRVTRILTNKGLSQLVIESYMGVSLGIDARGVTLNSDA